MTRLLLPLEHHPHIQDIADNSVLEQLKRLPRRVQQVVLLSRLDQLSFAAIAERLELPALTVERHMNQALQSVRREHDAVASTAGQWYVRLQSPQVTASERIDFRRWLDTDAAHREAFHATELCWRALLAPARQLGHDGWYRQPRAALTVGGCSVAIGLALAAMAAIGFWS
ncbi:DUF4880 domain-containing protein [Pseudomonas sp. P66]|jgi:hypothetical protein|uniref:DUF4880 domain-containing protein n=1 Tax=Pseudomonas arcuscaelestis TaxID=2710591 RepID=A0ABS2BTB1_9PSED|nr:DUF4880 domain-containing protein [Pseudomonas arcuscaelestis]MBM3112159.1 DUF4880 domain-containing protein [Pseudomonas arcuscaelestis]MBM5456879.1 DUF4880 domain-containing protein [Pseudomonas arcuscaelestis]